MAEEVCFWQRKAGQTQRLRKCPMPAVRLNSPERKDRRSVWLRNANVFALKRGQRRQSPCDRPHIPSNTLSEQSSTATPLTQPQPLDVHLQNTRRGVECALRDAEWFRQAGTNSSAGKSRTKHHITGSSRFDDNVGNAYQSSYFPVYQSRRNNTNMRSVLFRKTNPELSRRMAPAKSITLP